jgi:hypothetical protein
MRHYLVKLVPTGVNRNVIFFYNYIFNSIYIYSNLRIYIYKKKKI